MLFLFFIFIKISKFALPGVMLMYERTSNERKKERKMLFNKHHLVEIRMDSQGRIQRGGTGGPDPLENHKCYRFL